MAIYLNEELESEIAAKVRSGAYRSADDVIREGLDLINAREELRQAIAAGAAQLDRREGIPGEQAFEGLCARSQEIRSK